MDIASQQNNFVLGIIDVYRDLTIVLGTIYTRWRRRRNGCQNPYVIKFVSDFWQIGGFLRFLPPIQLRYG
jgi:hypothetical protein